MRLCSLLPMGWSAVLVGGTLTSPPPPLPGFSGGVPPLTDIRNVALPYFGNLTTRPFPPFHHSPSSLMPPLPSRSSSFPSLPATLKPILSVSSVLSSVLPRPIDVFVDPISTDFSVDTLQTDAVRTNSENYSFLFCAQSRVFSSLNHQITCLLLSLLTLLTFSLFYIPLSTKLQVLILIGRSFNYAPSEKLLIRLKTFCLLMLQ